MTATGNVGQFVISSTDNGGTWSAPTLVNADFDRPTAMTSFPPEAGHATGRTYFFVCTGTTPALAWSDDRGASIAGRTTLTMASLPPCQNAPDTAFTPNLWNNGYVSMSVARDKFEGTVDSLYVAYPYVTMVGADQRQDLLVARVDIDRANPGGAPRVGIIEKLVGNLGEYSIWRPWMIESDRWTYTPSETDPNANPVLLTWYEMVRPSVATPLTMRFRAQRLVNAGTSLPFDLSLSAGLPNFWVPAPLPLGENFYGHYDYGSFYRDASGSHFFAQWSESSSAVAGPNAYLYANIVDIGP